MKDFKVRSGETILYFGPNSTSKIREHLLGIKKVLIVTGKNSARKSGALEDISKILKEKEIDYKVYDEVKPNPTIDIVREITKESKEFSADAIVAIGGGSVIDSAKIACASIAEGRDPIEYLEGKASAKRKIPLYAVNLTHGTGSEIDSFSVINIPYKMEKKGIIVAYPNVSVDNPVYTLTLPKKQITLTSLDALYHILESYISEYSSPYVRDLDERAIGYIINYLPKAIENPDNIEYRYWLLYASMVAGIAIDHAFTYIIHGLEHGLSGVKPELEHAAGLAIVGPTLIRYIYRKMYTTAYRIMRYLDDTLRPRPDDAEKASKVLQRFQEKAGFNLTLSNYDFTYNELRQAVEKAWPLMSRRMRGNRVIGKEELLKEMEALL